MTPRLGGQVWPQHKDISAPHPFDGPYAILKGIQMELANLQAKLEAEQLQRGAEVHSLREECHALREALARERSERTRSCESLDMKVTSEIARHDRALKTFDEQTSAALRARTLCDDFQELNQRVKDLTAGLQKEVTDRIEDTTELDKRIQANTEGDNIFAKKVTAELQLQKQMLNMNTAGDQEFAGWVEPRILMAGRLLQAGASAPTLPPKYRLSEKAKTGLQLTGGLQSHAETK